nr:protein T27B7.4 [imported] - Caenorhabditis elegans [Caenorhabditis elegans]
MKKVLFPCQICGQNSHGTHFGIVSCRACAAFFRRSVNSKWARKGCLTNFKDKGSCFCKPCRLRKCVEIGMDASKFQYDRDAISAIKHPKIFPSVSYYVGRPEFLMFSDSNVTSQKTFIDVQNLVFEVSRYLDHGCETPIYAENQLKKLTLGFKLMQFDYQNVKFFDKIGKAEFIDIIEYYFLTVAKWIAHFDEFRKLDQSLQIKLLQAIWHVWSKIHKCASTAFYRKSNPNAKPTQKILRNIMQSFWFYFIFPKIIIFEKWRFISAKSSKFHRNRCKNCIHFRFMLTHHVYDFKIVESLLKLDPTDVELTFMFAQLCFEYAGKRFQGEILKITDHFQQVLSNDLHHYYITDQRRERYFQRLTDLMKVNNLIQRSIWETRPHRELGRVFEISKLEFSHPEMFDDSGFC